MQSDKPINNDSVVKSYRYGDTLELTNSIGKRKQKTRVIKGHRYVELATGEIKKMKTDAKNRSDNYKSVQSTMRKLRRLIANNFFGGVNELWITLTFKENLTDSAKAYTYFKVFMQRLRKDYKHIEYIAVIEPQLRGAWHFHVLLKDTTGKELFISNNDLADKYWKKGFVNVKRLKESDNVAAYVMAYVSDVKLPSTEEEKKQHSSKIKKGLRLHMYPKGLRIYRASRGIKKPIEKTAKKSEIFEQNKINSNMKPNFIAEKYRVINGVQKDFKTEYYNNLFNRKD